MARSRARAALGMLLGAAALLDACGQKGPLYMPAAQGTSAARVAHAPSAPDDRMPPGPAVQPMPSDEPLPAPTGVVPAK